MKNIIQILKVGNQELFYSSFIAWLLDAKGDHGLSDNFAKLLFAKINPSFMEYKIKEIRTEIKVKGGRADIFIEFHNNQIIVIENKTKSIGTESQLLAYQDENS